MFRVIFTFGKNVHSIFYTRNKSMCNIRNCVTTKRCTFFGALTLVDALFY